VAQKDLAALIGQQTEVKVEQPKGNAQNELFLSRLAKIRDKIGTDLEKWRPLQESLDHGPRSGKQLLMEERLQNQTSDEASTTQPSFAVIPRINSKSSLSNAVSVYPLALQGKSKKSNQSILNPKTVREWVLKE